MSDDKKPGEAVSAVVLAAVLEAFNRRIASLENETAFLSARVWALEAKDKPASGGGLAVGEDKRGALMRALSAHFAQHVEKKDNES